MRRMLLVAALGLFAPPAAACTISTPYQPLTARPAGTQTALVVDVVSLNLRRYPAVATVRTMQAGKPVIRTIPYWRAICGGRRDPSKGDRLVVYLRGSDALGWATPAEAKKFERSLG